MICRQISKQYSYKHMKLSLPYICLLLIKLHMIFQIELVYGVDGVYWNDSNQESCDPQGHITMLSATCYPQGHINSAQGPQVASKDKIFFPRNISKFWKYMYQSISDHFWKNFIFGKFYTTSKIFH